MSIFETIMLLCFGAAWPFSIYRSYRASSVEGKSFIFLVILLAGYVSGMVHKIVYCYDRVIFLYMLNFIMVSIDTLLYLRNMRKSRLHAKDLDIDNSSPTILESR